MLQKFASLSPLPQSQSLFEAVVKGDLKMLRQLFEQGQEMVVLVKETNRGVPALHFLAEGGHKECIEFLAQQGEDLKRMDEKGMTCTDHTLIHNHPECFEVLLKHGVWSDPEGSFNYFRRAIGLKNKDMIMTLAQIHQAQLVDKCASLGSFADHAAKWGVLECLDAMLALLPNNAETEVRCKRLAQRAAEKGENCTLNVVLKRGRHQFNMQNWQLNGNSGQTLLHVAKSQRVINSLLFLDFDINAPDNDGRTPAHAAALTGRTEEFLWLLKRGADIQVRDKNGATPIKVVNELGKSICHYAAEFGPFDLINFLVNNGGDFLSPDRSGKTAKQLATFGIFKQAIG
jgi:ankyrin repeat protein